MHGPANERVVAIHARCLLGVQEDIAPEVVAVIGGVGTIYERGVLCGIPMTRAAIWPGRGVCPHYLLD